MGNNLRKLRERAGLSQESLAKLLGTSRSMTVKLERGERRLSDVWIERAAKVFDVDPGAIVEDTAVVPVVGRASAGNITFFDADEHYDDWVEAPAGSPPDTVAFNLDGDSLGPVFVDGWRGFYSRRQSAITDNLIGKLCVIGTTDGRTLVKKVRRGRYPGAYDLQSGTGAIEEDVEVLWAAKIHNLTQK